MRKVAATGDSDVWVGLANRPFVFASPIDGEEFALLLAVADPFVTPDERGALSAEFVRQGCRYAVCTGYECSKWDDAIDWAFMDSDSGYSPPDERFVMTSWHEHEPLEAVVEYFRWNTAFDNFVPHHFLALQIGSDNTLEHRLLVAVETWFGHTT